MYSDNREIFMNQGSIKNWTFMANEMQKPIQEMLKLNVKTFQGLEYLKPEELFSFKQPGELLEKQFKLLMKNNHMILDYMEKSFQLLDMALLSLSKNLKENTDQSIKNSVTDLSTKSETASAKIPKTGSEQKKKTIKTKTTTARKTLESSKLKPVSMDTSLQSKVKPKRKATKSATKAETTPKRAVTESKKDIPARKNVKPNIEKRVSISNPILSSEIIKNASLFDLAVSNKKKNKQKIKMTKLENKMGMPDPKTDTLLNQVNIPDDPMNILPDINLPSEHHVTPYEHPMPEQEGKGKNPFKK